MQARRLNMRKISNAQSGVLSSCPARNSDHNTPMPITLNPISRRRFLAGSVAAGLGVLLPHDLIAADAAVDPHRLAFLSDIHIDADETKIDRGVVMYDHLTHVCGEVVALDPKPACAIINGDCAHTHGEITD